MTTLFHRLCALPIYTATERVAIQYWTSGVWFQKFAFFQAPGSKFYEEGAIRMTANYAKIHCQEEWGKLVLTTQAT